MSSAHRVRAFRYGDSLTATFDQVRVELPLYRGLPPEPVAPGSDCVVVMDGTQPVARVSLGVAPALRGVEGMSGLVGHFEARDEPSARAVLAHACGTLTERGVRRVLGPMNGSTWGRYRFALPIDDATIPAPAAFLGEPVNPAEYPTWFEAAGFTVAARYESRVDDAPHEPAADAHELAERVAHAGIRLRTLDPADFLAESRVLFELSVASFADNPYYTPIPWEEFRAQYEKFQGLLRPELVLFAENAAGRPVAFQFAYLDPLGTAAGMAPRVVVKTVATLPEARGIGLAGHLLDVLRERSVALGAQSMVHALMHVANFSMKMSSRHRSRVFRRYALYEWRL